MKDDFYKVFVDRVKKEAYLPKFLSEDFIYQLIDRFKGKYQKKDYEKTIDNPLDLVLSFYKDYSDKYYDMILEAINSGDIVIGEAKKSFFDLDAEKCFIRLLGNDGDVFMLAHEFAHYIDRKSSPPIIPHEYDFLCEVFPFYIEKQLENYLDRQKFDMLISTRRNNRVYFEARMLSAVSYELSCEDLYRTVGAIDINDLDRSKLKLVSAYDYDLNVGFVNYLLRYPLANILSDHLIDNKPKSDTDVLKTCLNANLYEVLAHSRIDSTDSIKK